MNPVPLDPYESFTAHLADREYFGQKLGLERIRELLNRLGNPERKFPSIHIAGTNGKGSTAAMIAQILAEAGYKVGLYTSPHLVDFCERIWVAGEVIPRPQTLHHARIICEVESPSDPLTFFELATAIAFLHFAEEKVDIAVVEVGLGGRLDATNVITPLVSVVTTIGMDHRQYLGGTIEKIAFEKAGIIKPGVPVVVGNLPEEAISVIHDVAKSVAGRVLPRVPPTGAHFIPPPSGARPESPVPLPLAGDHQLHNAAVAVAVIEELRHQGWKIPETAVRSGLANVRWPGRLETVHENPWILLDGAHNPQAMAAVRQFLEPRLNGRKLKVLFGAMADKDLAGLLSEIAPITDQFIFVAPNMKRAATPEQLVLLARSLGLKGTAAGGVAETLDAVTTRLELNDVLLVTGSLFVVGEAKQWFGS